METTKTFTARVLFVFVTLGAPTAAQAFVTLRPLTDTLETATRWAAASHAAVGGAGLYDGLSVAIEPDLAETLAIAVTGEARPEDVAAIEVAVAAAFAAWESPVIVFDVEFDGPVMQGTGIGDGAEIDVFVRPESDPVFIDNNFFGRTQSVSQLVTDRVLTNGTVLAGRVTQRADIFLNIDMIQFFAAVLTREQQPAALQRLLMHEIGHAMGFHHPNEFQSANYDTDLDPLNEMAIDPANPLADLMLSPNLDGDAIMSNRPLSGAALVFTSLRNDERGGRDALYPAPPPTSCTADCDADGTVSIAELVRSTGIALQQATFLACPAVDRNRDTTVTIDELVAGVANALDGCDPGN